MFVGVNQTMDGFLALKLFNFLKVWSVDPSDQAKNNERKS